VPVEIGDWRGRDYTYYQEDDGVRYRGTFGKLMNYRESENVSYKPVDLSLQDRGAALVMDGHGFFKAEVSRQQNEGRLRLTHHAGAGIEFVIPATFRPNPQLGRAISFTKDGLEWTYYTTKLGTKLEASVSSALGQRTFSFPYTLFGGAPTLSLDERGFLKSGDVLSIRPPSIEAANGRRYANVITGWQIAGDGQISFTVDDSSLPSQAYPYVIDPTTTFDEPTFMSGTDDQTVDRFSATTWFPGTGSINWTTNGTTIDTAKSNDGVNWLIDNGLWRWDTSSLPDSIIVDSATVSAYVTAKSDSDGDSFGLEWYQWSGSPTTADSSGTEVFNAVASMTVASITASTQYTWTVIGGQANISRIGTTYMRSHISGHPTGNANGPTGVNRVRIASVEHTTQREMRLNVTYTPLSDIIGMVHI
jgi:hypothetical protein